MRVNPHFLTIHLGIILAIAVSCVPPSSAQEPKSRQLVQPSPTSIERERRLGLVIGNGKYQNAPHLENAANDAKNMASALRSLGFEILEGEDLTNEEMKRLILSFGAKLRDAKGVGLFYYAGHGVQISGRNYLIPIDVSRIREETIEFDGVDVSRVLAEMDAAANGLNIVILDACRTNPFTQTSRSGQAGLATMPASQGTFIAYSTGPGRVAEDGPDRNSVFTSELLKQIRVPGVTIESMFKLVRARVNELTKGQQVPWESSSLIGDFYFSGKGVTPSSAQKVSVLPPGPISLNSESRASVQQDAKLQTQSKVGKVVLDFGVISSGVDTAYTFTNKSELFDPITASLKEANLTVILMTSLESRDWHQLFGWSRQYPSTLRPPTSLPYAIYIELDLTLSDTSAASGYHGALARVQVEAVDLSSGKTVASEDYIAKGFGGDVDQARKNALREAGRTLPPAFIKKVAEAAK
jgi:Caspase domain